MPSGKRTGVKVKIGNATLELIEGDITEVDVEAIVNAAGSTLSMGGGVAGALLRKGGQSIQEECDKIGHCPVGEAVITGAGRLKARYVIHTVGPRLGEGDEEKKLKNAILNALRLANKNGVTTIAFPAVSAGIFGFDIERGAPIMLSAAITYLKNEPSSLQRVIFCLYGDKNYMAFKKALSRLENMT